MSPELKTATEELKKLLKDVDRTPETLVLLLADYVKSYITVVEAEDRRRAFSKVVFDDAITALEDAAKRFEAVAR